MKKSVFLFLGVSVISVCALRAQTNTMPPSSAPTLAPATSTSTALTPPPDNAPPTTTAASAMAAPTPVQAVAPSAPVVTSAPTAHAEAAPVHVVTIAHVAPPRAVAQTVKRRAPHLYHLTAVSWIVATRNNLDVDDRYVTIVGHVTRRIGDDEYWFTDATGSVRLDSENFDLPIGRHIIVGGRIDQAWLGFGHLEVDVRRWRNY